MSGGGNLRDKENASIFKDPSDGLWYRRTTASGTFSPTGLTTELKITTMTIGDTATKIPLSALGDRNALALHNKGAVTLYIGNSDVTADSAVGTTSGWEVESNSFLNLDIRDTIEIYGRCEAGQSVTVKLMELA